MSKDTERADRIAATVQRAYEWAKNQNYQSVAARYAKTLANDIDRLTADLAARDKEIATWTDTASKEQTFSCGLQKELEAKDREIARLQEAQRWIPVEESLPAQNAIVLFMEKHSRNVNYGFWEEIDRDKPFVRMFEDGRKICFDKPDGGVWWRYRFGDALQRSSVTHWRPLPDPPQKGE